MVSLPFRKWMSSLLKSINQECTSEFLLLVKLIKGNQLRISEFILHPVSLILFVHYWDPVFGWHEVFVLQDILFMHQKPTYLTSRNTVLLLLWDWTKSSMMQEDLLITKLIILIFSLWMEVFLVIWLSGQWKCACDCLILFLAFQLLAHSRPNWLIFLQMTVTYFVFGGKYSQHKVIMQTEWKVTTPRITFSAM